MQAASIESARDVVVQEAQDAAATAAIINHLFMRLTSVGKWAG
jgi:hypothetical protein